MRTLMLNFLRKLFKDRRGNALVIAAAALPLLVGSAGLATDTIQWALWKRQLQRAADSAAIAGVYDRVNNAGLTSSTSTAVSHDLTLNQHTGISLKSGYPQVTFPTSSADEDNQVKVTLAVEKDLAFSSIFLSETPTILTAATAASVPGISEFCVVSLESSAANTGIAITGNSGIEMDCSFMSNSPAKNSAYAKGSSTVKAKSIAAVGGIQQSANW
ncbi:MAG: pilus assembly protein TadG-related protein, partial [Sphingomicrobium sp.]